MKLFGNKPAKQDDDLDVEYVPKPRSRASQAIRIVLTFIIIFLFALTIIVIYVRNSVAAIEAVKPEQILSGPISGAFTILSKGALQYNNSKDIVDFAKISYTLNNAANTTAALTVYTSNPVRKIYLLNTEGYCVDCFISSSLYMSLNSSLRQYGLIFNSSSFSDININAIDSIPKQSIIIIPSGLLPNVLLPNVTYTNLCPKYSNSTILSLVNNGDILLYVGRNFSRAVTCSGQVVQTPSQTMTSLDSKLNTVPQGIPVNSTNNPLNLTNDTFYFGNPTTYGFAPMITSSYGSASAVSIGQNGAMIALSNYPSIGWQNNYNLLADDIAKTIASRFWIRVISNGTTTIPSANTITSTFTIFSDNVTIPNTQNITSVINDSYPLVKLISKNSNSFAQFDIPVDIKFTNNGDISMPSIVGLGQQVQIVAQVYNSSNQVVIAYAQVLDRNLNPTNSFIINFGQIGPTPVYKFSVFNLPSGYYIVNLTDQTGAKYSSALFYAAGANVTPLNYNFKNGTFTFLVYSNGRPVNDVPFSATLDGGYNASGYIQNGVINYDLPAGTIISYGAKQFTITLLNNTYVLPYSYKNPGFNIPPLYIEVGIEALIFVLIAKFLIPPNIDEYYIDVPDVRPVPKQILRENSDAIVDVFTKVNNYYHWRDMPLTVDEVKGGISNYLKYGNTRVSITARNTYTTLNKLVAKGVLEEAGDYYAPKKWTAASNHSIEYLVIYRKLRDFCVANAMLFTELDSSSNMDMIITNKSTANYIKICTSDMHVKDMEIKQGSRIFIAFLSEEEKMSFLDKVYMSYGKDAEILKMAISYGNIKLIDTNHMDDLKL
jgi:hypothetical protein